MTLGTFFGHWYDARIFMATGYLTATGQNPYIAQDLISVFNNPAFQGMTSIGYPPPWAMILGLIYKAAYANVQNLLLYNLAIKIPIIAANIGLAYLTAEFLKKFNIAPEKVRHAWLFLLFNPLLLYCSAAWGQIDSVVAFFTIWAFLCLHAGKIKSSAVLLALAISFKPIAIPILPAILIYLWNKSAWEAVKYLFISLLSLAVFCIAPFIIFGWSLDPILANWNAHFTVVGGMSLFSFFELITQSEVLPVKWHYLGWAWIPILGFFIFFCRSRIHRFIDLLKVSLTFVLVFFLSRAWLSEPNILLVLPMVIILVALNEIKSQYLAAIWVITLTFTIFNASPPQLFFPSFPGLMNELLSVPAIIHTGGLIARSIIVIPWQIAGWKLVSVCQKNPKMILPN